MTGTKAALTFPISSTYLYPLWMDLQFFFAFGGKKKLRIIF